MVFTMVFAVILLGMQIFHPKKPVTPASTKTQSVQSSTAIQSNAANASSGAPAAAASATANTPATPQVAAASESTTVVENELYRITFSNRGGQVTSWILKKYTNFAGQPLDLVNAAAAEKFGYPLSIYTYDANLRQRLAQALYVSSATGNLTAPNQLTLTIQQADWWSTRSSISTTAMSLRRK